MDSCELVIFVSAIACAISNCCSDDELTLLSAVFSQLGDTIATIQAQKDILDKKQSVDKSQSVLS